MTYPPMPDQKREPGGCLLPTIALCMIGVLAWVTKLSTQPAVISESQTMQQREADRRIRALESETTDLRTRLTLLENRNQ